MTRRMKTFPPSSGTATIYWRSKTTCRTPCLELWVFTVVATIRLVVTRAATFIIPPPIQVCFYFIRYWSLKFLKSSNKSAPKHLNSKRQLLILLAAFWFHHSMIDRTWWVWQNQDLKKRTNVIAGTLTFLNQPPSQNATLDDAMSLGYIGQPNITVRDAQSTLGGPFCYIYA